MRQKSFCFALVVACLAWIVGVRAAIADNTSEAEVAAYQSFIKLAKRNSAWLRGVKEVVLIVAPGAVADKVASDAAYTLTHAGLRVFRDESKKFKPIVTVNAMVRGFLGKNAICEVRVTYHDYATKLDNPMAHGVVQVASLERAQSGVQMSKSDETLQQMSSQVIKDFATLYMEANLPEAKP